MPLRVLYCCLILAIPLISPAAKSSVSNTLPPCVREVNLVGAHALVLDAEKYPATTVKNAYWRYHDLNDVNDELRDPVRQAPSFLMGAVVAARCGQAAEARLSLYDEWAQLLRDQANDLFLPQNSVCRTASRSAIQYDIANNGFTLWRLTARLGRRDAEVRHVNELLQTWAGQYGMTLPSPGDGNRAEGYVAMYEQRYDKAHAAAPEDC